MTVTYNPIQELTDQQLDKILERFQLVGRNQDKDGKIKIIKCISLYDSKFGEFSDEDILVGFTKSGTGNLHDIKSRDESVKLMEDESLCNTCGTRVDQKDLGLRCNGCTGFFHNKCTSSPVSAAVFNNIVKTPEWVKVFCPKCVLSASKAEEDLKAIKENMEDIKSKVTKSYSVAATQQIETSVKTTQEMVRSLTNEESNK